MKTIKGNLKSASANTVNIQTPIPPQVQYPLEKPDSKKNKQIQTGHSAKK